MEYLASVLDCIAAFFTSIDYSPVMALLDLSDIRNVFAIVGAAATLHLASKKWGTSAVCTTKITYSLDRSPHISDLTIANLKDKPLVVYQVLAHFPSLDTYLCVQTFSPPLVIKGLEATSVKPEPYSFLDLQNDPFNDVSTEFDVWLVTERRLVKCKKAKNPYTLIEKKLKGAEITKIKNTFNGRIYSRDSKYALIYNHNGTEHIGFLLRNGVVRDNGPVGLTLLPAEIMDSEESIAAAIDHLSESKGIKIHLRKLP